LKGRLSDGSTSSPSSGNSHEFPICTFCPSPLTSLNPHVAPLLGRNVFAPPSEEFLFCSPPLLSACNRPHPDTSSRPFASSFHLHKEASFPFTGYHPLLSNSPFSLSPISFFYTSQSFQWIPNLSSLPTFGSIRTLFSVSFSSLSPPPPPFFVLWLSVPTLRIKVFVFFLRAFLESIVYLLRS